jgi:hypothetical protein
LILIKRESPIARQGDGECDNRAASPPHEIRRGRDNDLPFISAFWLSSPCVGLGGQIPRRRRRLRRSAKLYLRLPPMLDMSARWSAFAFPYRVGVDSEAFLIARNLPAIVHL